MDKKYLFWIGIASIICGTIGLIAFIIVAFLTNNVKYIDGIISFLVPLIGGIITTLITKIKK